LTPFDVCASALGSSNIRKHKSKTGNRTRIPATFLEWAVVGFMTEGEHR